MLLDIPLFDPPVENHQVVIERLAFAVDFDRAEGGVILVRDEVIFVSKFVREGRLLVAHKEIRDGWECKFIMFINICMSRFGNFLRKEKIIIGYYTLDISILAIKIH